MKKQRLLKKDTLDHDKVSYIRGKQEKDKNIRKDEKEKKVIKTIEVSARNGGKV